jgi:hypothetical protein
MAVGWLVPLLGLVAWQLFTRGETEDIWPTAWWTGLFAFGGWIIAVLPFARRFRELHFMNSLRSAWLGWGLLGATAYAVLTVPLFGRESFEIVWYPALVGGIAGVTFSLLCRREGADLR